MPRLHSRRCRKDRPQRPALRDAAISSLIVRGRRGATHLRTTITDRQPSALRDNLLWHELSGRGQLAAVEFEALQLGLCGKDLAELPLQHVLDVNHPR